MRGAKNVNSAAKAAQSADSPRGLNALHVPDGFSVEFDIMPKPVAAMSDLSFAVTLTRRGTPAADVSSVMLDLSMPGMVMGKNQPAMKGAGAGRYGGKGVIIRCASGKKTWQAEVTVKRPKRTDVVDFVFEVN